MNLEDRVRNFIVERDSLDRVLQIRGRTLIDAVADQIGLRELARRLGDSPPNVCALRKGTRRISPAMFLKVSAVVAEIDNTPPNKPARRA
jgi:hypothetical protein